ncbi:MAG: response regulator [Oscillatoria sp. SIO1A7]|nr:response regulator [Oscillatoria sp. SIO1A7]
MTQGSQDKEIILLVDDTATNLVVMSKALKNAGFEIAVATDGESAISLVEYAPPDLILLDVMMPGIDGFETCARLKANPQSKDIPVIFMTALADTVDKVKGLSIGAVDYITKPFQEQEVLARVRLHLRLRSLTKRLEKQNARLQQEISDRKMAQEANTAKSVFLAKMSHELRTPLNAILGFTQLLNRDSSLNKEQIEYLDIIGRSGEHLLSLINDILEMAKIESGRVTLNENSFDLYRLLDSLEKMFQLKADSNGLQLIFDIDSNLPQYIATDEGKLRQVAINLLSNAIKFTDQGSVTFRVKGNGGLGMGHSALGIGNGEQGSSDAGDRGAGGQGDLETRRPIIKGDLKQGDPETGEPGDKGTRGYAQFPMPNAQFPMPNAESPIPNARLLFEVEDTGPGIAPEEMETLFEAFVQTEAGRRSQQGTGLGLPISRQFVELMGSELTVESIVGKGTIFKFEIEVSLAIGEEIKSSKEGSRRAIAMQPDQPKYRILIVEDKWENRQLLLKLLEPLGFEVREAKDGQKGIDAWKSWKPHLIWMDMRMPVMNGFEATKEIKSQPEGRDTVIIALTASAFEEDRTHVLSVGCDDFVTKPIKEEEIFATMAKYLGVRYIYEDQDALQETPLLPEEAPVAELTAEDLAAMPSEWLASLHWAAMQVDAKLVLGLIEEVPPSAPVAKALVDLVDNFRFDKIVDLTKNQMG